MFLYYRHGFANVSPFRSRHFNAKSRCSGRSGLPTGEAPTVETSGYVLTKGYQVAIKELHGILYGICKYNIIWDIEYVSRYCCNSVFRRFLKHLGTNSWSLPRMVPTNIVAVCLLTNYTIGEQNGNGGMLISFHLSSMSYP